MRTLIWTTSIFIAIALVMSVPIRAQNSSENELEETIATARQDAEQSQNEAQAAQIEDVMEYEKARRDLNAASQPTLPTAAVDEVNAMSRQLEDLRLSFSAPSRSVEPILVIPTEDIKEEDLKTITEDMTIMSRLIDKKMQQANITPIGHSPFSTNGRVRTVSPYGHLFSSQASAVEGIYLQGYGALFSLRVDFALLPPTEVKEQKSEEGADPTWEEEKRELYSKKDNLEYLNNPLVYVSGSDRSLAGEYDAEKVEQLKSTIIKAFKHAANIRHLKPDDSVTVAVKGCAPPVVLVEETVTEKTDPAGTSTSRTDGVVTKIVKSKKGQQVSTLVTKEASATSSVLILIAKKSDIDIFSKGQATPEQFRQKVKIYTY